MSVLHRLIPSTRGAWRRASILSIYIVILAAALSFQAFQFRADSVYVYVQGDVAYARTLNDSKSLPLFPLPQECRLRWTNGEAVGSASRDEMSHIIDTGDWVPPNSLLAMSFASLGDVKVIQGSPWLTVRSRAGDIKIMSDCPPPAPTTHHVYIYVLGQHLFLYDTLDESLVLLMPLYDQLVWSGQETGMFTIESLVVRPEDKQGYAWLPKGAIVLGDFETGHDVVINNLDDTQVQLRYGTYELMLVSYNG